MGGCGGGVGAGGSGLGAEVVVEEGSVAGFAGGGFCVFGVIGAGAVSG